MSVIVQRPNQNWMPDSTHGCPPIPNHISIMTPPGLVSIIVPCCGTLGYTKLCVPSVLRHSRELFELNFLDIGSLDGTHHLANLSEMRTYLEREKSLRRIAIAARFKTGVSLEIPET